MKIKKRTDKGLIKKLETTEALLKEMGPQGEIILNRFKGVSNREKRLAAYIAGAKLIKAEIKKGIKYKEQPVDIETFLTHPRYLGMSIKHQTAEGEWEGELYPKVVEELKNICTGNYIEVVLTGSIGSAKTFCSVTLMAYQLYLLSILRKPHEELGLVKTTEIVFIFQAINTSTAKKNFMDFKAVIDSCPYFNDKFPYDHNVESELRFTGRIVVRYVAGTSTAALGQNTLCSHIDELNYMAVTDRSKQSKEHGTYDQAWESYNTLVRRRKNRFMKQGKIPGLFLLSSSKRYPGEFTDVKIQEAKTNKQIYVYDKREWDVKPLGMYTGKWFKLFVGDLIRKPRILGPHEKIPDTDLPLVMEIPEEFRTDFERDISSALRDIAGVATLATEPFIIDIDKAARCFGARKSILSAESCDFVTSKLLVYPNRFTDPKQPRWAHVDLGLVGDSAGVACGYVSGFTSVRKSDDLVEILPVIELDFILEVPAPPNGEIDFAKIRELFYKLQKLGLNIKWVTYDGWQSVDSLQILRRKGFIVGNQSMDKTMVPYEIAKTAFMDARVRAPKHNKGYIQFISLERDVKRGKIDHPSTSGSGKDLCDSFGSVVYGLTMRREIWVKHGVPLVKIPESILSKANTYKNSVKEE